MASKYHMVCQCGTTAANLTTDCHNLGLKSLVWHRLTEVCPTVLPQHKFVSKMSFNRVQDNENRPKFKRAFSLKPSYLHSARPRQRSQHAWDKRYPSLHHQHQALLAHIHGDVVATQTVTQETNQIGMPEITQQEDFPHKEVVAHGVAKVRVVHLLHAGDLGLDVIGLALDGHQGPTLPLPLLAVKAAKVVLRLLQLLHQLPAG